MKKNIIRNILLVGLELVFMFSVFKTCMYLMGMARDNSAVDSLVDKVTAVVEVTSESADGKTETESKFVVDFDNLRSINPDVRGWIRYTPAGVDYPLVQSTDNSYYLNHDYYKASNLVGSIFMDHRNRSLTDRNVVVFGHNTSNGSMFGQLGRVMDEGFLDDKANRIIEVIDTENRSHYYEIFSVYVIPEEEYYIKTDFASDVEYYEFLSLISSRSNKPLSGSLNGVESILTLSTCNDLRLTNKRLVVHARPVKR